MPEVLDTKQGTLVITTKHKPVPIAQQTVKQRAQQEQQIIENRAKGIEMGQDHNNMGNTQPAPPQDPSKLKEEW